ncbi:Predicted Fe-Mo cluster-binding protein, NifX family [Actinomyces ruminicola]|uniref:Predicted Fe-Mo cluster-binding protein, NifX family n=1 Tax=Actinomyces ruminicola TaxID=332524 RepID=A0A1H0FBD8_9ACTO|nr:NifB/NifX family molybdenum-iron cluster-binding protein [Actinomyces ruminicola]SDN91911.1 Predicted Fe-Mo cluster-binding protein, NifX family [Actinomyces ruminicola]
MMQPHTDPLTGPATVVLVPVTAAGDVEPRFGRAPRVAVATVADGVVTGWQEHSVGWDVAHDAGTEGSHHARIVRFLNEHRVDTIVAEHMGAGMRRVVARMGIRLLATPGGDARAAVVTALACAETGEAGQKR